MFFMILLNSLDYGDKEAGSVRQSEEELSPGPFSWQLFGASCLLLQLP